MKRFFSRGTIWALIIIVILILVVIAMNVIPKLFIPPKINITLKKELIFPELNGPFKVGQTSVYIKNKDQPALPGSKDPREWVVGIFYPALPKASEIPGPYAEEALKTAYSNNSLTKESAGALDFMRAHSYRDASADRSVEKFPVLLFSPGGGEQPLFYTSLLEQISSCGYIVVVIPEPFDTPVIPLPDGRILTKSQMEEWAKQDKLGKKAMSGDHAAVKKLMDMFKENRTKDMLFTLDQLEKINRENPILSGALDLEKVGAFGHSFGGASAVRLAQLDKRIDAVSVNDSNIFLVVPEDSKPLSQPVIFMTSSNIDLGADDLKEVDMKYTKAKDYFSKGSDHYSVNITGTTHQSFQPDLMFLAPYIIVRGQSVVVNASDTTPARITQVIADYNVAFFDQYLKGVTRTELAGPSDAYPEVTILVNQ